MLALLLSSLACAGSSPVEATSRTPIEEQAPVTRGETAAYTVEGDVVRVNNTRCAVSRSPLDPVKLDAFTSTVAYEGADPRFRGKKMVFNQCCAMCNERFPALWAADPDGILRYHGLI